MRLHTPESERWRAHALCGLRAAVACWLVAALTLGGWRRLAAEGWPYASIYGECGEWTLIAVIVTSMPLLGRVAFSTLERVLGTLAGGAAGYAAFMAARETAWPLLATLTALACGLAVGAGEAAAMANTGRLFGVTFVAVAFGLIRHPSAVAENTVARIAGVLAGVLIAALAFVAIAPRTGAQEALRALGNMLAAVEDATRAAWRPSEEEAGGKGGAPCAPRAGAATRAWAGGEARMAAAEAAADRLYGSSKALDAALADARYEAFCGGIRGHACLLPAAPCCAAELAPAARMRAAQRAARSVGRVQWAINLALEQGWSEASWEAIREVHSDGLLARVAAAAIAAAAQTHADFAAALDGRAAAAARAAAEPDALAALDASVAELVCGAAASQARVLEAARGTPNAGDLLPKVRELARGADGAHATRTLLRWLSLCWEVERFASELRALRAALAELPLWPGGRPAALHRGPAPPPPPLHAPVVSLV